jgi:hypothetical protein
MRKMEWRKTAAITALAGAFAIAASTFASPALALDESPVPSGRATESAPPPPPPESMSVVPEEETPPPKAAAPAPAAPSKKTVHHAKKEEPAEVEPASARLRIKRDTWIFSGPSKWTKHVTRAHEGKFVNITGSTKYYLQVKLKDGQTGYIAPADVDLVKPTDKVFLLTKDAAVMSEPNHWSKRVSEVHKGHNVHVIGVSLNYLQIRMKSGLVGFVPSTALQ